MQGNAASDLASYLNAVHALLARQEGLTRAMVRETEAYLAGRTSRDELAEAAMFQLDAYVALEADACALAAPSSAARAHELYVRAFAACGEAHRRLLRAIDVTGQPDLGGFSAPSHLLRAATREAMRAAEALAGSSSVERSARV